MQAYLKGLLHTILGLLIIFAIFDALGLSRYLFWPYSNLTGNKTGNFPPAS